MRKDKVTQNHALLKNDTQFTEIQQKQNSRNSESKNHNGVLKCKTGFL